MTVAELSDAQWWELARDLSARVAVYTPDWTEPVGNDPGVTIVELFGFLGESLLSRADSSPLAQTRLRQVIQQLQRAKDIACQDGTLTRNRFFTGKLLTADDLSQEQDYHRSKQRRHNRLLHGVGVVRGLSVSLEARDAGGGPTITVSPGVAISPDGEDLVVCEPVTLDPCQGVATCYVTMSFVERPMEPTPEGEPSRIDESAEVAASEVVPPGHLAIARLLHDGSGWRVDSTFRPPRVD